MIVQSVFEQQKPIPVKYTCKGEDLSPPLQFKEIPQQAKSLVLLVDDPDAPSGTFDHWIVWNIPPSIHELSEGAKELFDREFQVKQGINGFQQKKYRGPCPPPGKIHHYYFKLYALDTLLDLNEGASKSDVEQAMKGHIVEEAELIGTYQR